MKISKTTKQGKLPIIIFGAGAVGEVLLQACQEVGIKVACFCDNNINKTKKRICGIQIIHVPQLRKKYKNAHFLISAADMKDVVEQLDSLGYSKWSAGKSLLKNFDVYKHHFSQPTDFIAYAVDTAILCQDSYLTPKKLFLRSVDIMITERCSLKCRDCSNLMRYYKNPVNDDLKELEKNIKRLCSVIDEINEFRVIGGEPFMNKDSHSIIKKLIDEPKVKKVVIYTNGTIVPREEQMPYFKNKKILFIITDYGLLSRNLKALIQKLSSNKIAYYIQKAHGWTDCSKIRKHNRNVKQQTEIFKNCCAKNTITLSKDELHRCPFSANIKRLQAVPDFKDDYINIFDDTISLAKMKNKIRTFLLDKKFLKTCSYCNGRSFGDPEIKPAVQINEPLAYKRYAN